MSRRRGDDGESGEGRPVQPEEARAHGSDPEAVTLRDRGDAGDTPRGAGGDTEREASGDGAAGEGSGAAQGVGSGRAAAAQAPEDTRGSEDGPGARGTGWVEESAMRLLGAFYDLSDGKPGEEVPLGEGGAGERRGAAQEAGIDPASVSGTVERDVAVRYLVNQGYLEKGAGPGPATYGITASGIERVGRMRGFLSEPAPQETERSGMSEKMQTRLLSLLTVVIFLGLNRRVKSFVDKQIPERRGVGDDLLEATLQGTARLAAVVAASVLVRRLAASRR